MRLNKKVLCFIDEYGTAGQGDLYFGCVIVLARQAGQVDKRFSDQLELTANEIHAVRLSDKYLKDLMWRFWNASPTKHFILINRKIGAQAGSPPVLYAQALVETVKIGLTLFRKEVLKTSTINNVDVITDINSQNNHPDFDTEIDQSKSDGGLFRAVNLVSKVDSAASRLLQVADIAAYSRKFILAKDLSADQLHQLYGIRIR